MKQTRSGGYPVHPRRPISYTTRSHPGEFAVIRFRLPITEQPPQRHWTVFCAGPTPEDAG